MDTDYKLFKEPGMSPPLLEDMVAYLEEVHQDTLDKLHSLSADDLDRKPDQTYPERTIAQYFRHLIVHNNNHHGQIDYIRGLMQSGWDLPPGTGIVQP